MKIFEVFKNMFNVSLNEMAQNTPKRTGLASPIWIGKIGGQHGPRIKVSNDYHWYNTNNSFVVTISKNPRVVSGTCKLDNDELQDIFEWVILNYDILYKIYNAIETGQQIIEYNNQKFDVFHAFKYLTKKLI